MVLHPKDLLRGSRGMPDVLSNDSASLSVDYIPYDSLNSRATLRICFDGWRTSASPPCKPSLNRPPKVPGTTETHQNNGCTAKVHSIMLIWSRMF